MTPNSVLDSTTTGAREVLERQRAALLAEIRHDMHETCSGADTIQPDDAKDDLDAGSVLSESDVRYSLMHLRVERLALVDAALARIDAGCYGLCESCGGAISDARLRALPFALRCTGCEEVQEDAERARKRAHDLARRLNEERRAYLSGVPR